MMISLDIEITNKYFTKGRTVAVALSGGADSVCLLHMMAKLSSEEDFSIVALHLNHMIRGEEADRDEKFCEELCKELGIEFVCGRADVPLLAKSAGQSLEEAARNARYAFFEGEMRKQGIDVLATAHNADDNAETILLRMLRGTSLDGICGIPKVRETDYGSLVRPMLSVSKADILACCEQNGFAYVTDSTNVCLDYPRNRVRNRIIPELKTINPSVLSVFARNSQQFRRDSEFLTDCADSLLAKAQSFDGSLELSVLKDLHPALITRVIHSFCSQNGAFPENVHVEKICVLIYEKRDFSVSIPKKRRFTVENGCARVVSDDRKNPDFAGYSVKLSEGENLIDLPDFGLRIAVMLTKLEETSELIISEEKYSLKQSLIYNLSTHKVLNFDTINGELSMRTKLPGDKLDFGAFRKDLRRLMSEKKIPIVLRSILPCFEDAKGLAYVPFVAAAKRATEGKGNIYSVKTDIRFDTTEF